MSLLRFTPRYFSRLLQTSTLTRLRVPLNTNVPTRTFTSSLKRANTPSRETVKIDKPSLMLAFTCKKCETRSTHIISKQAYQTGSVLVQCPGCKNRHLIADHLNIFHDGNITIEDIVKAEGQTVTSNTADLCFEDIPESLKNMLGKYAKDAPDSYKKSEEEDSGVHELPGGKD